MNKPNRVCLILTALNVATTFAIIARSPKPLPNSYQVSLDSSMTGEEVKAANEALLEWTNTTSVGFFVTNAYCERACIRLSSVHSYPRQLGVTPSLQQSYAYQLGQQMGVPHYLPDSVVSASDLAQWQVAEWHMARTSHLK